MKRFIREIQPYQSHMPFSGRNLCLLTLGAVMLIFLPGGPVFSYMGLPHGSDPLRQQFLTDRQRVKIELAAQFVPAPRQARFALAVVLDVEEGWHLYANPKQGEFGMDTVIIPEPSSNIRFGPIIYPPGQKYTDEILGASNHIYKGRTVCYILLEATYPDPGAVIVKFKLEGLLCSDDGQCLPWDDSAALDLQLTRDSAAVQTYRPELFADFDINAYRPGAATTASDPLTTPPGQETAAQPDAAPAETPPSAQPKYAADEWVLPILMAVLAGMVMNAMPCVLPIIPIIVMTLMKQCAPAQGQEPDRTKSIKVGLAFAGGIMIVFVGLAAVMSSFKLLWGQHFQSNGFKFALLMIVYVLSLSMFGLFEIILPSKISNLSINRQGYAGAVGMGMLVTVLGTPCGAPLLGGVIAWSLVKPTAVTMAVFLFIGAGMATPYVLLTAFPRLLSRMPSAGNWMIRLKQAIGFCMLGFAAWLLFLFPDGWHEPLLYYCLVLGFGIWLGLSIGNPAAPVKKRYLARAIALGLIAAASIALARADKTSVIIPAEPWHRQLDRLKQQNQTAVVKFTANWCRYCAVQEKLIFKTPSFKGKLAEIKATLVIADHSEKDEKIDQMLTAIGAPGQALPFAAIFPGGDPNPPVTLDGEYSLKDMLEALDKAAARAKGFSGKIKP